MESEPDCAGERRHVGQDVSTSGIAPRRPSGRGSDKRGTGPGDAPGVEPVKELDGSLVMGDDPELEDSLGGGDVLESGDSDLA